MMDTRLLSREIKKDQHSQLVGWVDERLVRDARRSIRLALIKIPSDLEYARKMIEESDVTLTRALGEYVSKKQ